MQHLRGRIAKSDVRTTYVHVPTHPALCLGTSVPRQKVGVETHLGRGDMSAFVSPWLPLLERSLRLPVAVPFLGKAHEDSDHTAMIAVVH